MAMTLSDIRTKVRKHTNTDSTNTGGYTDAIVNGMINEAINEIAHVTSGRTGSTFASGSFATVASTRLYNIPSSCLRVYSMFYDGMKVPFKEITELDENASDKGIWDVYGTVPDCYYIEGGQIGFYPVPSAAKNVRSFFVKNPASLGADGDVPDLPVFLHPAIENYVSREIWLDRQKPDMASYYGDRYMDRINLWESVGYEDATRQDALDSSGGV